MSREDPDVSEEVQRILSDEGMEFLVGAETLQVNGRSGENVSVVDFDLRGSPALPEAARQRVLARLASRLSRDGVLVLASDAYRDQPRNRAAVLERLRALLAEAVAVPKRRRPTAPSAAARERRLADKRVRSRRKRERGRPEHD